MAHFEEVRGAGGWFEVMATRRSVRYYRGEPLPPELVDRLLVAASWAPSSHNRQPWRFALIRDRACKDRLARAMGEHLRSDRQRDGDPESLIERDVERSYLRITNAPVVVALCLSMIDMNEYPEHRRRHAEYLMAVQSLAMAGQNLLLAAHSEGLGACWLCAPLFCRNTVSSALKLPGDWEPQALVTLGWPAEIGKTPMRRPTQEIVMRIE
jgi:coenzyme F420-0:L-glutamate ligase/coenzyme F420-1:gamma-L-glutamate ligase